MSERRALLSVYHKDGIVEFAAALIEQGFSLVSSGGTARHLVKNDLEVVDVADITNMPAILGHRVVTLNPKIHGALMALPTPEHDEERRVHGIPFFHLVCVDLYPLEDEIAKPDCTLESVIEKTDVGGPSMLHSAAKGRRIVVCDPTDRMKVIEWLREGEPNREVMISRLVTKAEAMVAKYCAASAGYHEQHGAHHLFDPAHEESDCRCRNS